MTCQVEGCDKPSLNKGMCKLHYQRTWRTGSPHVSRPCLHLDTESRFWLYTDKRSSDECWEWKAIRDKDGYGKLRVGKANVAAHRVSWVLHFGEIRYGLMVLHKCHNSACTNPSHLYLGDHVRNMLDRSDAGHYATGERSPASKYSDELVELIRKATGTLNSLSKKFGVSASQIGNIRSGRQRKSIAYCKAAEEKIETPTLFDMLETEDQEVA